jgi:hypothetical protein
MTTMEVVMIVKFGSREVMKFRKISNLKTAKAIGIAADADPAAGRPSDRVSAPAAKLVRSSRCKSGPSKE